MEHNASPEPRPILVVGSANLDLVVTAARFPRPGETLPGSTFSVHAGGKGANQAAASARLGHPTLLFAHLGDDPLATTARTALAQAGVDLSHLATVPGPSGTALITVAVGDNTILIVPGANQTLSPAALEARWPALLAANPGIVLAQLEIPLETVTRLAELCHAAGLPLVLDPAPAPSSPLPPTLLRHTTWLTPNETEAHALTGLAPDPHDPASLAHVAAALLDLGPENVILKLGSAGCYLAGRCGSHRIPALPVRSVDSTAAGDCFNGAFSTALLRGLDPPAAARFAAAAAALSTTRPGAMPSLPTAEEVTQLQQSPNGDTLAGEPAT